MQFPGNSQNFQLDITLVRQRGKTVRVLRDSAVLQCFDFKFEMLYVVLPRSRRMHARDARVLRYACVYTYVFVCLCFMFTLYDVH